MKQGRAQSSMMGSTMTQPVSKAISPGAVSRLGAIQGPGTVAKPMISGPGLKAPMVGQTNHKCGSQGRH